MVPVTYVELSETEELLALATLDPLSAIATTDAAQLRELLGQVEPESKDVRALLADLAREIGMDEPEQGLIDEDELPADHGEIYVETGEIWLLGDHRLMIGDSRLEADVDRLLDTADVDMVWTDPPYGVDYVGKTNERLTIDNDDEAGVELLLTASLGLAVDALRPGGAIYVCAPGGVASFTFADVLRRLKVYRQTICWVKDVFVMGRQDFQWRHELVQLGVKPGRATKAAGRVIYGWRPGAAHYFIPERDLDTVWEIPRPKASREHPTMKPVELVRRCISYSSRRGDVIYDPFVGSGTTIIAAQEIGRRALAMEIDPMYAQRAIERWQAFTGQEARRG
jgi:DNA modification methylase